MERKDTMKKYDLSKSNKSKIELQVCGLTRILRSSVEIDASIKEVWEVFNDYKAWEKWNSFIPMVRGNVKKGNVIEIKVLSPGMKEMIFKPEIFVVEEMKQISWGGKFLFLYNGIHECIFEEIAENKTRFIQIEKFQGPIVLFMNKMINQTALGYIKMNEELKDYIEK
jgi:hypothetical protein